MNKLITVMVLLASNLSNASISNDTHLGCQLYIGEPRVFHELRKFNISKADENGKRTLEAYLAGNDNNPRKGTCQGRAGQDTIECEYVNSQNRKISVSLNSLSERELNGTVFYDGWIDFEHEVSCELLSF